MTTSHIIEFLAEQFHNAWWEEKKKQGFHTPADCKFFNIPNVTASGRVGYKFERCCNMCHTDMYPYDDRVTVRRVLKSLGELTS